MLTYLKPLDKINVIENSNLPVTDYRIIRINDSLASSNGLMSEEIFGLNNIDLQSDEAKNYIRDNIMSYIKLKNPVINPIMAGSNYIYLSSIFDIKRDDVKDIVLCNKVLDVTENKFVSPELANSEHLILYQGQVLSHIIKNFDCEHEIRKEIYKVIKENLFSKKHKVENYFNITTDKKSDLHLIGEYYACLTQEGIETYSITQEVIDNIFIKEIKEHKNLRLINLMRLREQNLENIFLTDLIQVTPAGMRPSISKGQDPMSIMYSNIILAEKSLNSTINFSQPVLIATKYRNLYNALYILMKNAKEKGDKFKSIIEMFTSKKALVRGKQQGKRVDFSGRSPIVVAPDCSIDEAYIPQEMFEIIMSFHLELSNTPITREQIINEIPIILNRAPTLHRLSIQGFWIKIWDKQAIGLHPLVCAGYNADFDGDQMAVHVPITPKAILEVRELMMSSKNLFVPSSGEPNHVPKQEMLYGLNYLSTESIKASVTDLSFNILEKAAKAFENQETHVHNIVTYRGKKYTLGRLVIMYIFPKSMWNSIGVIDKDNIKSLMKTLSSISINMIKEYVKYINLIVKYSFLAATLYPPNISIFEEIPSININGQKTNLSNLFDVFEEKIYPYREAYLNGLESHDSYSQIFQSLYGNIDKAIESNILNCLGNKNGYGMMTKSGSKGSANTLKQITCYKGQIEERPGKPYNVIIKNSYSKQLTPTEHILAAIGSRMGLIDKSIKPGETGEIMRLMKHTASDMIITEDDCGTTTGLKICKHDILRFNKTGNMKSSEIEKFIIDVILGRYDIYGNFIDINLARKYAQNKDDIIIRSPITCKNPCCSKCYGVDLTYKRKAVMGTPVGVIAAQSIGEPGTQMTMRTFHKGGVSLGSDMTSEFDRISKILKKVKPKSTSTSYDPVAWKTGKVIVNQIGYMNNVQIQTSDGEIYDNKIKIPVDIELKEEVIAGEGLCKYQGELDIDDICNYSNVLEAAKYIVYKLYNIYFEQTGVNIKHFEVLAASMIIFVVTDIDTDIEKNNHVYIGMYANLIDYYKYNLNRKTIKGIWKVCGVEEIPRLREHFLAGVAFRQVSEVISQAVIKRKQEDFTSASSRIMLGRAPYSGTKYIPPNMPNYNYIKARNIEEENLPLI